ncbi:hypothetical protein CHCC20375_1954 [Bacillus licheniformis]|nr:hypothetical protein CHCC20375_1954 [Bacillus licheniformis]
MGCSIGKVDIERVVIPILPFYAAIMIVLLIVTYIPQISLMLPQLFGL